jgi:hypothetical protein
MSSPEIQGDGQSNSPLQQFEMQHFGTLPWHPAASSQQRQKERNMGIHLPLSNLPAVPFSQTSQYSPIAQSNPYTRIPRRKPVLDSLSFKSISTNASSSRFNSDPDIQNLIDRRAEEVAAWGIHWWTPFSMGALFILGVIGAISHHIFYNSLHGQEAKDQLQKVRYGTALAFFTKATLVGSVILGYRQRIWYTLRRKAMTLGAIDSLFGATEDPTLFSNWEMIKNAKLSTLMAAASW